MGRILALLLALAMVVSATTALSCMGVPTSLADQHSCCDDQPASTPMSSSLCCAVSQQTRVRGPVEPRAATPEHDRPLDVQSARWRIDPDALEQSWALPPPVEQTRHVPLYLAQLALLI